MSTKLDLANLFSPQRLAYTLRITAAAFSLCLLATASAQPDGSGVDTTQANPNPSSAEHNKLLTPDDLDESLHAAAKNAVLPLDELRAFVNAFTQIRKTYVETVDDETLLRNAIKGMLMELDPHSSYLEPESYDELQVSATGEFGGLGLEVGMEDGFVKVIAPIDDTPAERAGLESGDLIVSIDGEPVKGLSLNDAVKLMRGKINTSVKLLIVREGIPQPFEVAIVRDVIEVVSVRSRFIEDEFLYLRIAQFQGNTGKDLKKVLDKAMGKALEQNFSVNGLVLDLRNNPGGVLQAAVEVVDTFIAEGLIVYTEGRIPASLSRYEATVGEDSLDLPMIVLINGGSASASEIVAGALQDHKRAIILGTTSFGKGSVQSVVPLSTTHGMKLTTARYFTPNGRSIQAQGIEPDILIERAKITRYKPGNSISEADLRGHLTNDDDADRNKNSNKDVAGTEDEGDPLTRDNQLYEAINLLKGLSIIESRKVKAQPVI